MSEHTPISERGRKIAATVAEKRRRRRVRWLWRAFNHHARLYDKRLNNLRYPESLVHRAHADASEFLALLREEEPLAQLIHWPAGVDTTVASDGRPDVGP